MPLGIVSNSDFESELTNSGDNNRTIQKTPVVDNSSIEIGPTVTSDVIIKRHQNYVGEDGGRNLGDVNVPQSLRKLIGDTATYDGRAQALSLAREMGVSPASVAAYTNPQVSSSLSETNKNDISNFLTSRKQKISKRAINKLAMAINMIDKDKLRARDAVELSNVAKNMAQVVKSMEPDKATGNDGPKVQFVMFAPQVKNEMHYDTVVAKDNY